MSASPTQRRPDASIDFSVDGPTNPYTPLQLKIRRGKSQKICKGFFWRGAARLAVLGGEAELRHFAGNRFELRCKIEPSRTNLIFEVLSFCLTSVIFVIFKSLECHFLSLQKFSSLLHVLRDHSRELRVFNRYNTSFQG